jgi:hypothetical protein
MSWTSQLTASVPRDLVRRDDLQDLLRDAGVMLGYPNARTYDTGGASR